MQKLIAACVCFLFLQAAQAQKDTGVYLQGITVHGETRFNQFNTGSKVQKMDSIVMLEGRYTNLADLLGNQSQVFVKSYGLGSIATTSFRGAGAAHTAVLWNSFNLQSSMHGEFDFSLMPAYLLDEVKVQYGGNGMLYGSGAVGGAVHLATVPQQSRGIVTGFMVQPGSFGHMAYGAKLQTGGRKYSAITKYYRQQSINDFSFSNKAQSGSPEMKQKNAQVEQNALATSHRFQLSTKSTLQLHGWYQFANRHIPPAMTRLSAVAFQQDETYRGAAEWKHENARFDFAARQAVFYEMLNYDDPDSYITGRSNAWSSISEVESKVQISARWQANIGINNTYAQANSNGYPSEVNMNRTSLFYSLKATKLIRFTTITLGMRNEWVDGKPVPACPSIGTEVKPVSWLKISAVASASYRVPTFNNKYWTPGGNPQLKPERGWGQEMSIATEHKLQGVNMGFTITGFNRKVDNWIVWLPKDGYWTPQNVKSVWSRGGEVAAVLGRRFGHAGISYSSQFNYVLSTNHEVNLSNDGSLNRQLIYTPRLTHQHEARFSYRKLFLAYNHMYTGVRFTATDHTEWLDPYQVGALLAGTSVKLKSADVTVHFKVNNIWNSTYQAVLWRPTPLVNYMLTFIFNLHFKPTHTL